jgi:hypothetical protein
MITTDLINGCYECLGGLFISFSIVRLYKDKIVRGVSFWPVLFFQTWGIWNLIFYPSVECWLSFYGGLCVTTANTIWLIQMFYYIHREKSLKIGEV